MIQGGKLEASWISWINFRKLSNYWEPPGEKELPGVGVPSTAQARPRPYKAPPPSPRRVEAAPIQNLRLA